MTVVRLPRLSRPVLLNRSIPSDCSSYSTLMPISLLIGPFRSKHLIRSTAKRSFARSPKQIEKRSGLAGRAICLIDELANTVAIELLLDRIPAHTLESSPVVSIQQQISSQRLGCPIPRSLSKHTHSLVSKSSLVRLFPSESNQCSKVRDSRRGNASAVGTRH